MPLGFNSLRIRESHPLCFILPFDSARVYLVTSQSYNPSRSVNRLVWAVPRSLATTQGITICFLFLPLLRCFSSRRSPHINGNGSSIHWVAPFGDTRIKGHLHLPESYRSLSRPSSPSRAKASACCPFLLHFFFLVLGSFLQAEKPLETKPCSLRFNLAIKFWIFDLMTVEGHQVSIYFTT